MKKYYLLLPSLFLFGCGKSPEPVITEIKQDLKVEKIYSDNRQVEKILADSDSKIAIASRYMEFHERRQRKELQEFINVDPVKTDWCAAFVNSVLKELGIPGSDTVSEWPLTARSFLHWGRRVKEPRIGDIVVFPRGEEEWQGHVGFYYGTEYKDGRKFYQILGGNQSNAVTIELFPARSAVSIRRYHKLK
jgi:uncharacterized protein (TIGR02594 family)